jgi:hypothetical protein
VSGRNIASTDNQDGCENLGDPMLSDARLVNVLKDDFFQIAAVLSCAVLLTVGYLGALPASWLPWVWLGFAVSVSALAVSVLAAFLRLRS